MRDFKTIDDIDKSEREENIQNVKNQINQIIQNWSKERKKKKKERIKKMPFKDKFWYFVGKFLAVIGIIALFILIVGGAFLIIKSIIG